MNKRKSEQIGPIMAIIFGGILISFGIAITVSAALKDLDQFSKILGFFGAGLFIGIGLIPVALVKQ